MQIVPLAPLQSFGGGGNRSDHLDTGRGDICSYTAVIHLGRCGREGSRKTLVDFDAHIACTILYFDVVLCAMHPCMCPMHCPPGLKYGPVKIGLRNRFGPDSCIVCPYIYNGSISWPKRRTIVLGSGIAPSVLASRHRLYNFRLAYSSTGEGIGIISKCIQSRAHDA